MSRPLNRTDKEIILIDLGRVEARIDDYIKNNKALQQLYKERQLLNDRLQDIEDKEAGIVKPAQPPFGKAR